MIKKVSNKYGLKVLDSDNLLRTDDIVFQLQDAYYTDKPLQGVSEYNVQELATNTFYEELLQQETTYNAYTDSHIVLFGTTMNGSSVSVRVPFSPSLFLHLPSQCTGTDTVNKVLNWFAMNLKIPPFSLKATVEKRERYYGWIPKSDDYTQREQLTLLRLELPTMKHLRRVKYLIQDKVTIPNVGNNLPISIEVYEEKVSVLTKFFDTFHLVPSGWILIKGKRWLPSKTWYTHSQIEITCAPEALECLPSQNLIAPLLIASVDIECVSGTQSFPEAENVADQIITISTTFHRYGNGCLSMEEIKDLESLLNARFNSTNSTTMIIEFLQEIELVTIVYTLGEATSLTSNYIVESFDSEEQLLHAWRDLIVLHSDPDIITGWNIYGFDWKYMADRLEYHYKSAQNKFFYLSRLITQHSPLKKNEFESKAYGQSDSYEFNMIGRVVLDLYRYVKREYKFVKYTLDFVSFELLQLKKIDLPPKELFRLWFLNTKDSRSIIAQYCARDTELPLKIFVSQNILPAMVEMSRVTYTTMCDINSRGQQIKVYNQIVIRGHKMGVVINHENEAAIPEGYEGATVVEPKSGFYSCPIATLDFASLYPSIMRYQNLCPSRLVMQPKYLNLPGVKYNTITTTLGTHVFVSEPKGVLPVILEELLAARKQAKKEMSQTKDPELYKILHNRQLSLKISCNSVYGFCGANENGICPCLAVADATTAIGREIILDTKRTVEANFPGSVVVYGDTDSVFVKFAVQPGIEGRIESFRLGALAAQQISGKYKGFVNLEMEKIYDPLLLFKKKRYVGLKFEDPQLPLVFTKMEAKGIELVRRDTCKFVTETQEKILHALIVRSNPIEAEQILQQTLTKLVNNEIEFEKFIITKSLKRTYANPNQVQLVVVEKMKTRNRGSEPKVGDRVPYVITDFKKQKLFEKVEDPVYAQEHKIPLDFTYYLTNGLMNSIQTFFEPFHPNPSILFDTTLQILYRQNHRAQCITTFLQPILSKEPKEIKEVPTVVTKAKEIPIRKQMTLFGTAPVIATSIKSQKRKAK